MTDDPWKGDESNVIKETATCPPGMRIIRDGATTAYVSSFTFGQLGIDPEKVRKATERLTFLSIDSMKKADDKP